MAVTMIVTGRSLQQEEQQFLHDVVGDWPSLLESFPLDSYNAILRKKDLYEHYEGFPEPVINTLSQIKVLYGQAALANYHKISLCRLMRGMLEEINGESLSRPVCESYADWFSRIVGDFRTQPDTYYDIHRPLWPLRKDISVCCGRSMPVGGAWVIAKRWLPRRAMISVAADEIKAEKEDVSLRKVVSGAIRALRVDSVARRIRNSMKRSLGRYDLCYTIHTIERNVNDFNAEKMEQAYRNIAGILKQDDAVWGLFRMSWFLDPMVGKFSPELAWLSGVPLANGAELYDQGPGTDDDLRKATLMSVERSRLYATGDYEPRVYCDFWPRDRVIDAFGE
jgi:hypothetical protein